MSIVAPVKFEITPEFAGDDQLIESLYGEVGFSQAEASSKGTARITVPQVGEDAELLADYALNRTIVTVENFCAKNQHRYRKKRVGLTFARIRPAATTIDKQESGREFEAFGFGYFEDLA